MGPVIDLTFTNLIFTPIHSYLGFGVLGFGVLGFWGLGGGGWGFWGWGGGGPRKRVAFRHP
jgi:hypothetical protein